MDRNLVSGEDEQPAEPAAASAPRAEDPRPSSAPEDRTAGDMRLDPRTAGLPAPLRDWRVLEIDGEATVIETVIEEVAEGVEPAAPEAGIPDTGDEWIIAHLSQRHLSITPGSQGTITLELLNNGPRPARFAVRLEGWVDERWVKDAPLQTELGPGEWSTLHLHIALPRAPEVLAGDRRIAVIVQSPDFPGHRCRLGLTLTVEPFGTYVLGQLRPAQAATSWLNRAATFVAPVANRSNAPIDLVLQGGLRSRRPQPASPYALTPDELDVGAEWTLELRTSGGAAPTFGAIQVHLAPAETQSITVRATPNRQQLFGMRKRRLRLRLTAEGVDRAGTPQVVHGTVACAPFLGPLHVLFAGSVLVAMAAGLVFLGVALSQALWWQPPVAPAAPASLPSVAIIVNMAAPVPTRPADLRPPGPGTSGSPGAGPLRITSASQAGTFDPAAPVVLPGQVSAPGAASVAGVPAAAEGSLQPERALTYSQMFQDVALRYDLDWRLLAAQAYVESGFDTLAIGPQGALGLMQILPATWNEWAPAAGVNDPFDAYQNVMVAGAYLDYLRSELGGMGYPEREWMLVAYNWGPDKLMDFLRGGGTWDTLGDGVRTYATEALRIAETIPTD